MKRRILSFGIKAANDSITNLKNFSDPISISDYDALILDPNDFGGQTFPSNLFSRRQKEIGDLVDRKGGIIISILRPSYPVQFGTGTVTTAYHLFGLICPKAASLLENKIRPGEGSQIKVIPTARGVLSNYFRVLQGELRFVAYFGIESKAAEDADGIVVAVNSARHPIAIEFTAGPGRLCFVPIADGAATERLGAAFAKIVDAHFGGPTEIEAPTWAEGILVPGAGIHDTRIVELEKQRDIVDNEIVTLSSQRRTLLSFRQLLFGYGTSILEPVVRSAFGLLGFNVPEPATYVGEWDVELRDPISQQIAIGEIEGSAGVIDVDKYRQLLDYYQGEVLEGRKHKGILIGNGYRLKELDSPERQKQFSEHALNGATANGFCLLPTTELFNAVCSVLKTPNNEHRNIGIRESILKTVGVWKFREQTSEPIIPGK